ncbi:hypothetical protein GCM10010383_03950 [Streptomyces lomondensis]|uniref:Uncharacterized protein n=2 Tax=Streptomyces lomondensis TaxID=68229 RepID=A0ABQ2WWV1_9ACTN|nr:hypothetical protein GCM10010383_03950 [Streptomyces lomondensis]
MLHGMTNRYAFTERARTLASYMTLAEMEAGCDHVRKASWWSRITRFDESVQPPVYDEEIAGIAKLFGTTREQVRAMIAEEWLGVAPEKVSSRVKRIMPQVDALEDADFKMVEQLVNRLTPAAAESGRRRVVIRRKSTA